MHFSMIKQPVIKGKIVAAMNLRVRDQNKKLSNWNKIF